MAKKEKSERSPLARAITRGREHAGSMSKLVESLGDPPISKRTLQEWEQDRMQPADYVAAVIIERIEKFLKSK